MSRVLRSAPCPRTIAQCLVLILGWTVGVGALDWSAAEQQLARKIAAVTGNNPVSLAFENRSSIGKRDSEIIQNGLRSALERAGVRFAPNEPAATVTIFLSENQASFVWVAQIRSKAGEDSVVMVSMPRPAGTTAAYDSVPLSLRKIPLWSQADPILDVAVLEENAVPTRVAVLSPERVSVYRFQGGKWQLEQALEIAHNKPWPRDLRGRLVPGRDHLLDAYLPGVVCHSAAGTSFTWNCREGDDPWPLMDAAVGTVFPGTGSSSSSSLPVVPTQAVFDSSRNFFTAALGGKFTATSNFYSAALLQQDKSPLWLFAAVDRQLHIFDGTTDRVASWNWGSDLTSVRTSCGAGWQILTTSAAEGGPDFVSAYEVPDRNPVAVSAGIEFPGPISALWTETKGDTAVAVAKNLETGNYEAFRLAVGCSQ